MLEIPNFVDLVAQYGSPWGWIIGGVLLVAGGLKYFASKKKK